MEKHLKGWKGALAFTAWAMLFLVFTYFSGVSMPGKIAFTREIVVVKINAETNRARTDAYMLYENNSNTESSIELYYPVYSTPGSPFLGIINMTMIKGEKGVIDGEFQKIYHGCVEIDTCKTAGFKPINAEITHAGAFVKLKLKPKESAVIHARYEQDCGTMKHRISLRHFGYAFTNNTAWGRPLKRADFIIGSNDDIKFQVYRGPGRGRWHRSPLEMKVKKPKWAKDGEYRHYYAGDYVDPGFSVSYRKAEKK